MRTGRTVFLLVSLGLVGVLLVTAGELPPVVASHFDGAGAPNGWSSRSAYVSLTLGIGILLPLGIVGLVHLVSRGGPAGLNIPAREYTWWLGAVLAATALLMHAAILAAHRSDPPRLETTLFLMMLGAVLLGIAAWIVGWYRLLGKPEETKRPAGAMAPPGRKSKQD